MSFHKKNRHSINQTNLKWWGVGGVVWLFFLVMEDDDESWLGQPIVWSKWMHQPTVKIIRVIRHRTTKLMIIGTSSSPSCQALTHWWTHLDFTLAKTLIYWWIKKLSHIALLTSCFLLHYCCFHCQIVLSPNAQSPPW